MTLTERELIALEKDYAEILIKLLIEKNVLKMMRYKSQLGAILKKLDTSGFDIKIDVNLKKQFVETPKPEVKN